jgi:hypothetical protein
MKRIIIPFLLLLVFSCTPKPKVSEEQRGQFESCKATLIENKDAFIALGKTQEKRDSLKTYIADLEQNNLDQLLEKYEVEEEQVVVFIYSVCQKAGMANKGPSVEESLNTADSMIKVLDSIILKDSLKNVKSH